MPAARVCEVIYNMLRDSENSEPRSAADFMPDADRKSDEEGLIEFAEMVAAGELPEVDPAEFVRFKKEFNSTFA